MDAKKYLIEIFDYYEYKINNNQCIPEEMESAVKLLDENMKMYGTIEDFAKFYNVSEGNVRATINRKLLAKPKRRVYYPFHAFRKIVPESWRKDKSDSVVKE